MPAFDRDRGSFVPTPKPETKPRSQLAKKPEGMRR